jgi:hypothetical protein
MESKTDFILYIEEILQPMAYRFPNDDKILSDFDQVP